MEDDYKVEHRISWYIYLHEYGLVERNVLCERRRLHFLVTNQPSPDKEGFYHTETFSKPKMTILLLHVLTLFISSTI